MPKQDVFSVSKYNSTPPEEEDEQKEDADDKKDDQGLEDGDNLISSKEAMKIYQAAELVQKHYLEMKRDQDVSVEKLLDEFLERGQ